VKSTVSLSYASFSILGVAVINLLIVNCVHKLLLESVVPCVQACHSNMSCQEVLCVFIRQCAVSQSDKCYSAALCHIRKCDTSQ
jgi:hypothetical protein